MGLRLGDKAPNFRCSTTMGPIDFYDWKRGSWCLFFSHPEEFTPVCTTEMGAVSRLDPEWQSRNTKVLGLSCCNNTNTLDWIDDINRTQNCQINFPLVKDFDRRVATLYNMLDYQDPLNVDSQSLPLTMRCTFLVDASNTIRMIMHYPSAAGRNFVEVLRSLDAIQLSDMYHVGIPAGWKTVDDPVIVFPGISNASGDSSMDEDIVLGTGESTTETENNDNGAISADITNEVFPGINVILPYLKTANIPNKERLKQRRLEQQNIIQKHQLQLEHEIRELQRRQQELAKSSSN